jgi:hypothetical protein
MAVLDHLIRKVNDLADSVAFYVGILGFTNEGESGPFNTGPGEEIGARGTAPRLYFNDPNRHLIEIRAYPEI